jgi:hypothetical protein
MDRRTTIKWMLAASAAWPLLGHRLARGDAPVAGSGYGTDPNLLAPYHPGMYWPLTLTAAQRRLAGILCDLIIPADEHSPSASSVGVVDFIDEWVSAPYPVNQKDRPVVLGGFAWLDEEATRRSGRGFADLSAAQQSAICDAICDAARAAPAQREAAQFFSVYRDLTAGGFYSSPAGRKDLSYIGNVPLEHFPAPPAELLAKLGLA